eukprot:s1836_g8.t1
MHCIGEKVRANQPISIPDDVLSGALQESVAINSFDSPSVPGVSDALGATGTASAGAVATRSAISNDKALVNLGRV